MVKRRWSDEEMVLAFYLYRFGYEDLGLNYSQIADIIERTPDSLGMRLANYLSIEREGSGLYGGGQRVEQIYNQYREKPKEEIKQTVLEFLHRLQSKMI